MLGDACGTAEGTWLLRELIKRLGDCGEKKERKN